MRHLVAVTGACLSSAALFLFTLSACNTPFIPLPPPGDPTFTPVTVTDGIGAAHTMWQTSGTPAAQMADAKVSVFNLDVGVGVMVRAKPDGSYVANPIEGREGDRIQIQFESRDLRSSPDICRVLQAGLAQTECRP